MTIDTNNQIESLQSLIAEHNAAIAKLKKLIPMGTLTMLAFGFGMPLIPGRRTHSSLADNIGYPYAAGIYLLIGFGIYVWGYRKAVNKRKVEIVQLESRLKELRRS